ncbi:MAG: phytanoyl-CoA dioxygenase family protein, partial [Gammaproteobacteria bacterium]
SALWALDDFTEENGATRIVMGTSDLDEVSDDDSIPIAQAIMPKGSVVMYLGSTIHGGGANYSSESRKAAVNTYALGWLRQEENQYLALSPQAVASQSDEVQRLLGFQAHGPHLGVWPDDPDGFWFDS